MYAAHIELLLLSQLLQECKVTFSIRQGDGERAAVWGQRAKTLVPLDGRAPVTVLMTLHDLDAESDFVGSVSVRVRPSAASTEVSVSPEESDSVQRATANLQNCCGFLVSTRSRTTRPPKIGHGRSVRPDSCAPRAVQWHGLLDAHGKQVVSSEGERAEIRVKIRYVTASPSP